MSVMSLKVQSQRMSEFQNEFGKYQNQYRDLMHNGKQKDAMAPLTSCIALLDTTTIFKVPPIAEVRERLINDQPLMLCETANWNHESQQTKEYYLETYMAKNLYYFVCKKLNSFNPESLYRNNDPADDVRLIPVSFVNNNWKCDTTTNPEVFWAKP
ncbi:MAG: hypothetical protein ACI3YI_11510 [Bacteroidaceae bacterium]